MILRTLFVFLSFLLPASAYVLNLNNGGKAEHWDLSGTNTLVKTNVVNRSTRAIRFFVSGRGYSTSNTAAEINAVRASFAQWQSVPGLNLRLEEGGVFNRAVDINTADGTNVVFWATNTLVNGGFDNISGTLGVTFTSSTVNDNVLKEADIVLNGVEVAWFTDLADTTNRNYFVEGVLTHEIGHFLGLSHSPVGGATMFYAGGTGICPAIGLSADDLAGARRLYGNGTFPGLGSVTGRVSLGVTNVFGAVVLLEDMAGNAAAGTVTLADGTYQLTHIPAGAYQLRVSPLDPNTSMEFLMRPFEVDSPYYDAAQTTFLPSYNTPVTVAAGMSTPVNLPVLPGTPAFRISQIRLPTTTSSFALSGLPVSLKPGSVNYWVGVASPNLPTTGALLSISGDGLTLGAPVYNPNVTFTGGSTENVISVLVTVATNATPGLRTLTVQRGTDVAYAPGFFEVSPLVPDYNFDGLDDRFQRQYFPLWTSSVAAPGADPDGDGVTNAAEYLAGTSPTDVRSLLKVQSVRFAGGSATVVWQSVAGKRYQVFKRADFSASGQWTAIGPVITANGATAQLVDGSGGTDAYYRVQVVP